MSMSTPVVYVSHLHDHGGAPSRVAFVVTSELSGSGVAAGSVFLSPAAAKRI